MKMCNSALKLHCHLVGILSDNIYMLFDNPHRSAMVQVDISFVRSLATSVMYGIDIRVEH